MEITKFKKGKSNTYEITLDNGESYKIYDDILLKYELLIDKNLTEKRLKTILAENDKMDAYYRALKYLNIKMRSELEIRKYLIKCGFDNSNINYVLDILKKEGYINVDNYTKAYINDQMVLSMNGPKKISDELRKLGIADAIFSKYLEEIEYKVWKERIIKIVDKKAKVNKNSLALFKNKMYSNLIMLGYESSMISEVLDNYSIDTSGAFLKEASKVWNHLNIKYEGKDLELHFKNKMYSKGYSLDEINKYINNQ